MGRVLFSSKISARVNGNDADGKQNDPAQENLEGNNRGEAIHRGTQQEVHDRLGEQYETQQYGKEAQIGNEDQGPGREGNDAANGVVDKLSGAPFGNPFVLSCTSKGISMLLNPTQATSPRKNRRRSGNVFSASTTCRSRSLKSLASVSSIPIVFESNLLKRFEKNL